jgi:hypothetical protein
MPRRPTRTRGLYRKADGRESRLCFMGHVLMENRNGLALDAALTRATGTAEREAALSMLDRRPRGGRVTLGTDKAYDVTAFVQDLRDRTVTPHIAVNGVVSKRGLVRRTRSTAARRAMPATPSAKGSASASRRCSVAARGSAVPRCLSYKRSVGSAVAAIKATLTGERNHISFASLRTYLAANAIAGKSSQA